MNATPEQVFAGLTSAARWDPTTVTLTVESRDARTVLQVIDKGYTSPVLFMDCAAGWGEALTLLKFYLEHGITDGKVP